MGKQKVTSIQISVEDVPMQESFRDRSQHSCYRQYPLQLGKPRINEDAFPTGEPTRF